MKHYQLQAERIALDIQRRNFPDTVAAIKAGMETAYQDGWNDGADHVYQMRKFHDANAMEEARRMHRLAMMANGK